MQKYEDIHNSCRSCIWFYDVSDITLDLPRTLPGVQFTTWFEYSNHNHRYSVHGYAVFPEPILHSTVQLLIPSASWYMGNLSMEEIEEYCRRSETATAGPFISGEPPYFHATQLHLYGIYRCTGPLTLNTHYSPESLWQSAFGSRRSSPIPHLSPTSQFSPDNWLYFNPRPYKTSPPIPISPAPSPTRPAPWPQIARRASHSHANSEPRVIYHSDLSPVSSPITSLLKDIYDQNNK